MTRLMRIDLDSDTESTSCRPRGVESTKRHSVLGRHYWLGERKQRCNLGPFFSFHAETCGLFTASSAMTK
jgi:hypothetical protein